MSNKTVKELKSTAKELGLKGYSKLRKIELIKMIEDYKHNESANKLRSFSKEFGARHRNFIKKIDRKRNSSNILDEAVPEINTPTLKSNQHKILDTPVPEINVPILKPKRLELKKLAARTAKPIRKNINQFADWILSYVPQPIKSVVSPKLKNLKAKINSIFDEIRSRNKKDAAEETEDEKDAEAEETEEEEFDEETKIELVDDGKRVKKFKITGNLNFDLTKKIMAEIKPKVEMRTRLLHVFSCIIYWGEGEIVEYSKTFKSNKQATFANFAGIEEYIHQCEQKRLDLEDSETWSQAYLPATMTYDSKGVYEGKVLFRSVDIKLILSNEPLLGCGRLPEWLANKKCIYAIDKVNDNLCVWRCLAIHQRITKKQKRSEEDTNRDALRLARDFYARPKLKTQEVSPTRLIDFEKIAKHFGVNIRLFEPKTDSQEVWKLVYGKGQATKINKPCVDIGLYDGHCFYIKDIELLTKHWECVGCQQRFNRHDNYNSHVNNGTCTGGKTKVICQGQKFKKIMSSSEKVFYGGNTQFSQAACQWIERQAELLGKHIHHALCGHGGEYCVTVNKKDFFLLMAMSLSQEPFFNTTVVNGIIAHAKKIQKNGNMIRR